MYLRTNFFLLLLPFPFLSQREHSWRNVRLTFAQESKYSSKGKTSCTWVSRRPFRRQTHNCLQLRAKCSSYKCFQYNVSRLSSLWLGPQGRKQLAAELCQPVANWRGGWLLLKHTEATGLSNAPQGVRPLSRQHMSTAIAAWGRHGPQCPGWGDRRGPMAHSLCKGGTAQCLESVLEIAYVGKA